MVDWTNEREIERLVRAQARAPRRAIPIDERRRAAVLVPVVLRPGAPALILTRRTMTVATHKGQVSFPGGMAEPDDDGPVMTALREAREEIALAADRVEVIGLLDDMFTVTGWVVTQVLGIVDPAARCVADPAEVAEVFEAPLPALNDPALHRTRTLSHRGEEFLDHTFDIDRRLIWGATGRMIERFLARLEGRAPLETPAP